MLYIYTYLFIYLSLLADVRCMFAHGCLAICIRRARVEKYVRQTHRVKYYSLVIRII